MAAGGSNEVKPAAMGIASCIIGGVLLLIQVGVLGAVMVGVQDNQGIIYAFSVPFFSYLIGVPLGLSLAIIAFLQPNRSRTAAKLGLLLTLTGPLIFLAFLIVREGFG